MSNMERRILYKRFNQWRQRPKVDVHEEMSKIKDFEYILKKVMKTNLYPEKELKLIEQSKGLEKKFSKILEKKTKIY